MPKVKAKNLCFVDHGLRQPGDVFDYKGPHNHHLEYLEPMEQATQDELVADVPQRRLRKARVAEAAGQE